MVSKYRDRIRPATEAGARPHDADHVTTKSPVRKSGKAGDAIGVPRNPETSDAIKAANKVFGDKWRLTRNSDSTLRFDASNADGSRVITVLFNPVTNKFDQVFIASRDIKVDFFNRAAQEKSVGATNSNPGRIDDPRKTPISEYEQGPKGKGYLKEAHILQDKLNAALNDSGATPFVTKTVPTHAPK